METNSWIELGWSDPIFPSDLTSRDEPGVDWLAKLGDDDQIIYRPVRHLGLAIGFLSADEVGDASSTGPGDMVNAPCLTVNVSRVFATLWKEANLIPPLHGPVREFDGFRNVTLEIQPERTSTRQRGDLPF